MSKYNFRNSVVACGLAMKNEGFFVSRWVRVACVGRRGETKVLFERVPTVMHVHMGLSLSFIIKFLPTSHI